MCGICGKLSINAKVEAALIEDMARVLKHRGPDDRGVFIAEAAAGDHHINVGLGHSRLSIIDLTKAGHQPMSNEDKSVWIVLNGEIYNFPELRQTLEKKGHTFSSRSDTEVVIHLYEDYGTDCVKQLRGMFAFAIWDANKRRLILCRDRLGKKPLNYTTRDGSIIFASEIKAILKDSEVPRGVNIESLHHFLTYQYVPAPQTMFEGIKKLPPAHMLIWENGEIKIEKYWEPDFGNKLILCRQECCERMLELLIEAVRIRMISDVPLGVFLSGGIDSTAVVAIIRKFLKRPLKTFSIGFKEPSFNESAFARKVAEFYSTEHREYIVEPDALEILPKLVWHFNEPFADSSAIPLYYLSRMARQEVTVALNGDGGDEAFGGYDRYAVSRIADAYRMIPWIIRKYGIEMFIAMFPESTHKKDFIRNFKRFSRTAGFSRERRYASWMSIFDNQTKEALYSEGLKDRLKGLDSYEYLLSFYKQADTRDFLDATFLVDILTYLPGDLLVKADIATMANSLEVRSPFLDHKLIEFAAKIHSGMKVHGLTTKYILKKMLEQLVPKEILQRKKFGFGVPIGTWFRKELKAYAYGVLLDKVCLKRGYFKKDFIQRMLNEHTSGRADHGSRIWSLINLELWHRMFIDGKEEAA